MRGTDERTESLFSYVSCEARVPAGHPLRLIRAVVDEALEALAGEFEQLYARIGRPSIPPEKLLRALLLQAFYSVRSERQLMEQLDYNLLFRWFVGLSMDAPVWDASTFSKNRDRLLAGDIAQAFLAAVVAHPRLKALMSSEHLSIDGTLIGAWASHKSFRPKGEGGAPPAPPACGGRNGEFDWRGERRSNETHASTTDPDARLARKADGQSSVLAYAGHVLMENRSGLVRLACATHASGTAERDASLALVDRLRRSVRGRITLGADKGYDAREHVEGLRARGVTPHIARNDHKTKTGKRRRSAIDRRTTRHPGYAVSQVIRKRVEEVFGWIKETAGLRQTRHRGLDRVGWTFTLAAAAYNLVRLPGLLRSAP
ncbi:IS5 family transposase [Sabulicella glaciei]|uniref:IS5 family transposase n=1 Tax=Sabulicella glaciei TaxID=2984948 RepID=A0ABT3P282_9PROT|nr:IS5 family transposase [Roseococcus sp. MDT2-1-1]MCW8088522.1 IS5 family transposase [Roseococcus sp. MDT2-1-1]